MLKVDFFNILFFITAEEEQREMSLRQSDPSMDPKLNSGTTSVPDIVAST